MPVVNGIAAAIALGSAHPHYAKSVELLVDSHSSANKTGHESSEDDEDDEEDYTYGYNRFHCDYDEGWPSKSSGTKSDPETETHYDDKVRAQLLVVVAIGAARSISVRMEGTPGMMWQGVGFRALFGE